MPIKSLIGRKFGKLEVVKMTEKRKRGCVVYECLCECGNKKEASSDQLMTGHTKSCGCLKRESPNHLIHGKTNTRIHKIWVQMKQRCENPKNTAYKWYGKRGVKVCESWHKFENFYDDVIRLGYRDQLTMDRIDNNGDYGPNNIRFVNREAQANNRRNNIYLEYKNKRISVKDLAELLGLPYTTIIQRVYFGWSIDRIVNTPLRANKRRLK